MKTLKTTLAFLLVALAVSGCGRAEGRLNGNEQATITRAWPASSVQKLNVFELNGSITVEAVPTDQISLVATARGDLERIAGKENDGLFVTSLEDGTLNIGRQKRKKGMDIQFFWGNDDDMKIDYVLKVPAAIELATATVNGRITTRGAEGETTARTVNGTIDVETSGAHELQATTVNGKVRAKFTHAFNGATFKTVNGGVEAILPASASFDVDLSQVNGGFDTAFPLSIHSSPGSRRVSGEVNGGTHRLKIVTVNGDIDLERTPGI